MLLQRYGSLDYVANLDLQDGIDHLSYIYEQRAEEQLMQRWIVKYQDQMGYDEFKQQMTQGIRNSSDNRTSEEILEGVKAILDKGVRK